VAPWREKILIWSYPAKLLRKKSRRRLKVPTIAVSGQLAHMLGEKRARVSIEKQSERRPTRE
jgi:hypothetical protein